MSLCLDHDTTTLSKFSTQKYPRCSNHVTNMAASGSSNGQSNSKESGGYSRTFCPQQESPVEYVHYLILQILLLNLLLHKYEFRNLVGKKLFQKIVGKGENAGN